MHIVHVYNTLFYSFNLVPISDIICIVFLREDQYDVLTVCDWGQKLSYYYLNGKQVLYYFG